MFIIEVPYVDLDQIYNSCQSLRWIRITDQKYVVMLRDKATKVEFKNNRLVFSCDEKQFFAMWYHYFDMGTDYFDVNYNLKKSPEEFVRICSVRAKGVRIVQQDLFEVVVTSMLGAKTNRHRVRFAIDMLCQFGKKHKQSMKESGIISWHEFPLPEQLLRKRKAIEEANVNNHKDAILEFCTDYMDGWFDTDALMEMSVTEAREHLLQFDYITESIADKVCLYALGFKGVIPKSLVLKDILDREFGMHDLDEVKEWFLSASPGYEGIAQQYFMYNELNDPEEEDSEWD